MSFYKFFLYLILFVLEIFIIMILIENSKKFFINLDVNLNKIF